MSSQFFHTIPMTSTRERFKQLLKDQRQSVTAARLAVFDALAGGEPRGMQELAAAVPQIDRASVYRAIELFERLHVIQRVHTGWKFKVELSDHFAEHHHHLTCTSCGQVISISEAALEEVVGQLGATHGFRPTAHQIEIQGICRACQQKKAAMPAKSREVV
jgi:Fur family ferric uptake transcriptional regulator